MKKSILFRLLIVLVIVINFLVLRTQIYLLNIIPFLLLVILSIPALIRLRFSIPLAILLFISAIGQLFNIFFLGSNAYIANSGILSLIIPVIELGTVYLLAKPYLPNIVKKAK